MNLLCVSIWFAVHLRDVDYYYDQWSNCSTNELESTNATSKRARAMARIQQSLIAAQELGDEKLQVVTQLQEMIDQKTRQLDADFKNLDYGAKDDPALIDALPKDAHPNSPSSYVPSSSSNNKSGDARIDENASMTVTTTASTSNDRTNTANSSNIGSNSNSSNANNGGDRSWKRSRRARNELSTSRSNSGNSFTNVSKSSQMDLTSDANAVGTNQSKSGNNNSTQQSSGNASNSGQNKKQSGNSGSASKKRKRKSGRAQSISGAGGSGGAGSAGGSGGNSQHQQTLTNISRRRQISADAEKYQQSLTNNSGHDDTPPLEETIDPDEPTYCLCDQISFGEMILCDNDLCPIEWFHFSCVSLTTKPKGKWFCPNCRGERPSVMKPKQQFLKELERYNREKEEKT